MRKKVEKKRGPGRPLGSKNRVRVRVGGGDKIALALLDQAALLTALAGKFAAGGK